jgi:hypothetical protein
MAKVKIEIVMDVYNDKVEDLVLHVRDHSTADILSDYIYREIASSEYVDSIFIIKSLDNVL